VPREPLVDRQIGDVLAHISVLVIKRQSGAQDEGHLVQVRGAGGGHRGVATEMKLLSVEQQWVVGVTAWQAPASNMEIRYTKQ
jgi:shikimate 5-dehydrogenase